MKEKIYCPSCEGTDVKTTAGKKGGEMDGQTKAAMGLGGFLFGGIWLRNKLNSDYIPIYHHCNGCGKDFMSMETYEEEMERAKAARRSSIGMTVFWGLLGLLFSLCATMEVGALIAAAGSFIMAVIAANNIKKASVATADLEKEMVTYEQAQSKHSRPLY